MKALYYFGHNIAIICTLHAIRSLLVSSITKLRLKHQHTSASWWLCWIRESESIAGGSPHSDNFCIHVDTEFLYIKSPKQEETISSVTWMTICISGRTNTVGQQKPHLPSVTPRFLQQATGDTRVMRVTISGMHDNSHRDLHRYKDREANLQTQIMTRIIRQGKSTDAVSKFSISKKQTITG